ncbi:hypothetical protein J2S43_003988 [Catenuloplanes nepalensis]|uniref:Putative sensor domain-containing protein n=1 Tax=Catenuloplanes nepalensis TaxID=587533 RepID=A0ABT9MVK4_9ACTN|nr:hypothetical protein [Catenuloplanes nepalensis]
MVACGWLLCLPLGPWAGVPLGAMERWRLGWVAGGPHPTPHRPPPGPGPGSWLSTRMREPATR